jgi:hypothetical protein
MTERIIEIEAESLEQARERIRSQIPEGFHLLSEKVISDGKPKTVRVVAGTIEEAFAKAQSKVPNDADVLEKKEITAPQRKVIIIEAYDGYDARRRAEYQAKSQFGDAATVGSLKLKIAGKKGFLGIGRKPNQYEAEILQPAIVELTYRTKARISARIDTLESLIAALGDKDENVWKPAVEALAGIGAPAVEPLVAALRDEDEFIRRGAAEALLALRLRRMVQLDEDRYADNALITHAEYQLFLDEFQAQGKYHQPDHWSGYQFPIGQELEPVVGVRFSDAVAFCEWLTQRELGRWYYLLPQKGEPSLNDLSGSNQAELAEGVGYWVSERDKGQFVRAKGEETCINSSTVGRWIIRDLKVASDLARELDLDRARKLDLNLANTLAGKLARASDRASHFARDLDRARGLARDLTLATALASALVGATDRNSDLALASALVAASARDPDFALALDRARNLAAGLDLNSALVNSSASALVRGLVRALASALASSSANALDRACTKAHDMVRDLVHDLPHDLSTAIHLDRALDYAQNLARRSAISRDRDFLNWLACASDRASTSDLSRADPFVRTVGSGLSRLLGLSSALYHALALAHDLGLNPNLDLDLALDRSLFSGLDSDRKEVSSLVRQHVRFNALTLILGLEVQLREQLRFRTRQADTGGSGAVAEAMKYLVDTYFALYMDFCILEERIQGSLSAVEGIRIIKERKKKDA